MRIKLVAVVSVASLLLACGTPTIYPIFFDFRTSYESSEYPKFEERVLKYAEENEFTVGYVNKGISSNPSIFLYWRGTYQTVQNGISVIFSPNFNHSTIWFMEQGFSDCKELGKAITSFHESVILPMGKIWVLQSHEVKEQIPEEKREEGRAIVIEARCQKDERLKNVLSNVLTYTYEE